MVTLGFERIIGSVWGIFEKNNWSILLAVQNRIIGGFFSIIASPLYMCPKPPGLL
jgi:hypothetical protein